MLETVKAVIEELGGQTAVARLVGRTQPAVSQWIMRGNIPPEHYFAITDALDAAGRPMPLKELFALPERPTHAAE